MATLGTTSTPGAGNVLNGIANNLIASGPYTMTEAGTVTKVSAFIKNTSGSAIGHRCGIYADNAGVPGALVSMSSEVSVADGTGSPNGAWVDFTVTGSLTNAAKYWITFWVSSNSMLVYYNLSGPGVYTRGITYTTGAAPDPFGSGSATANEYAVYITYTPAASAFVPRIVNNG
jgi:hypothetical protein